MSDPDDTSSSDITLNDILARYLALGGDAERLDVEAHQSGLNRLDEHQSMIFDHALWELENHV